MKKTNLKSSIDDFPNSQRSVVDKYKKFFFSVPVHQKWQQICSIQACALFTKIFPQKSAHAHYLNNLVSTKTPVKWTWTKKEIVIYDFRICIFLVKLNSFKKSRLRVLKSHETCLVISFTLLDSTWSRAFISIHTVHEVFLPE